MSAVSIAWSAVGTGQMPGLAFLFRLEHDSRVVSAGINATEKQISFCYKAADEKGSGNIPPA